jgi:hypothetical protein
MLPRDLKTQGYAISSHLNDKLRQNLHEDKKAENEKILTIWVITNIV